MFKLHEKEGIEELQTYTFDELTKSFEPFISDKLNQLNQILDSLILTQLGKYRELKKIIETALYTIDAYISVVEKMDKRNPKVIKMRKRLYAEYGEMFQLYTLILFL